MFRLTFAFLFVMLATFNGLNVAAQMSESVIVVQQGREQSLLCKKLSGASVGNVGVIHIESLKPNEVVIFGVSPGESSLNLTQRDGRRTRLTVRVLATHQFEAWAALQTTTQRRTAPESGMVDGTTKTPSARGGEAIQMSASEAPGKFAESETAAAIQVTPPPSPRATTSSVVAASPVQREMRRARRSRLARVEISAETTYQLDTENVRVVSAELLKPEKLQEAVDADSAERLATISQREQTMTVRRSSVVTPVSILYEINDRNSLTVIVPYIRRQDEITVGASSVKTRGKGVGDIQLRFERMHPRLRGTAWDGSVEFNVALPTGKSIYNVGKNESPLGIGHYEVGSVIGARRIFDPVTFNAALGINYALPRTVQGTRISPGLGYSAQTGFGFALSDRWVFSEQMNYTRRPNVFLSTPTDAQTVSADQSYLSHSLIYRPRGGHTMRMMFNLGLNPASSDYGFGFTYTYRSKDKMPQ